MPDVSLLITAYKRSNLLDFSFQSIINSNNKIDFEIIVLNDYKPDNTEYVCKKYQDKLNIKYIYTGVRNLNGRDFWRVPGFALNIGAKKAQGEVIILSCAEMFHSGTLIDNAYNATILNNFKSLAYCEGKDDVRRDFLNYLEGNHIDFSDRIYKTLIPLNTNLPFFMGMNKQLFLDIGGYDEDFTGTCWDDNDIVSRMQLAGCKYELFDGKIVHLYHEREGYKNYKDGLYNKNLFLGRKKLVNRNQNREWGVLH